MATKQAAAFDTYIEGLNEVLRALAKLPKEATQELKQASEAIATKDMAPAWRSAAMIYAGPWGSAIANSVRVKKDRLPAVSIGYQKKVFDHGASTNMVRFLTDQGNKGRAGARGRAPSAFGEGTDWMKNVAPRYAPGALVEWGQAVDRIVTKWVRL